MLVALLLFAAAQDGCLIEVDDPVEKPQPMQAAGEGLWIGGIGFGSSDIASAVAQEDDHGMWVIEVHFSPSGNTKFIAAQRCGVGRAIEISVDRKAISRLMLNEPITGGMAQISGGFSARDAKTLAERLTR